MLSSFWHFNSLKFLWSFYFLHRQHFPPLFDNIITFLLVLKEHIEYRLHIDKWNEGLKLFRVFLETLFNRPTDIVFFRAFSFSAFKVLTCTVHLQIIYPDCIPNAQVTSSWVLLPQSYLQIYWLVALVSWVIFLVLACKYWCPVQLHLWRHLSLGS